jgi:glycosyltransferase involved in cell wall biosynthesis
MLNGVAISRVSTVAFFVKTQLLSQLKYISNTGANLYVITSLSAGSEDLERCDYFSYKIIPIKRQLSFWFDMLAFWKLFTFFRKNKIIINHSTTPKAGLISSISSFFAGVPIRLHTFTGQAWVNKSHFQYLVGWLGDYIIAMFCTHCYADSNAQKEFLVGKKIICESKISIVGSGSLSGVDLCRFNPFRFSESEKKVTLELLCIPKKSFVITFIGRVNRDKGILELLLAFQAAKKLLPNLHLVIVGEIDNSSGSNQNPTLFNFNAVDDLHFLGHSDEPERYLSVTNVLCLPSYREGFGTVAIEAAAMGIPVIASDIYGLKESVIHMETGIKIQPKSEKDLENAIIMLASDETLCKKLGVKALNHVVSKFNSQYVNNELIQQYELKIQALKKS